MGLNDKDFQELLIRLSPTILGVKPAELLNVKLGDLDKCRLYFQEYGSIKFIEIKDFANIYRRQLFFYHPEYLSEVLKQKANQLFLKEVGYPLNFELNMYLKILIKKLQSNVFPHEIGIFLGYPLKDVLGYMGVVPLKLVKIKGWKYYGSENLSTIQYQKYLKARDVFCYFLNNITLIKV